MSPSRSHSRRRSRSPRRYSRSRSRSPYSRHSPSPSSQRRRSRSRSTSRRSSQQRDDIQAPTSADKARLTIFCSAIHPRVTERDLFEFFSLCGDVNDIRLVRDGRGKSKGLCYVEFAGESEVVKACALNGQMIGGYPITIQPVTDKGEKPSSTSDSYRVYVGSLRPDVTEFDLRALFSPFGQLLNVETYKDASTGQSKGFAFLTFAHRHEALMAMQQLEGVELKGRTIKVGHATQQANGVTPLTLTQPINGNKPIITATTPSATPSILLPSVFLCLSDVFDLAAEKARPDNEEWMWDIRDEIIDELGRTIGNDMLVHIAVDTEHVDGRVYLRAVDLVTSVAIHKLMLNRWFEGRQIQVTYVNETEYLERFKEAKNTETHVKVTQEIAA